MVGKGPKYLHSIARNSSECRSHSTRSKTNKSDLVLDQKGPQVPKDFVNLAKH
jgi:hypothetical protein